MSEIVCSCNHRHHMLCECWERDRGTIERLERGVVQLRAESTTQVTGGAFEAQCWICPLCHDDHHRGYPCGEWVHRALVLLLKGIDSSKNYAGERDELLRLTKGASKTTQDCDCNAPKNCPQSMHSTLCPAWRARTEKAHEDSQS